MTLTEEQRGALARAIDYINETDLPVGELDGFDREVLRSMVTTAINYGPDVMKMIELLAAGEHDQWADWAQSILDSEPGLSDGRKAAWPEMIATPYENLSEELKDKDRREVYLRSGDALAEIERLRAENLELQVAVFGPDGIRAHQACIIADQAARISELEIEIAELKADLEQSERVIEARLDVIDQQAARIKELESSLDEAETLTKKNAELMNAYLARIAELEDALVEERAGAIRCEFYDHCEIDLPDAMIRARQELQADGKIGPGARPPCWQITEERKAALWHAIKVLKENDIMEEPEEHLWDEEVTVLQAMLTEAE